jgi:hypothetical protein
MLVDSEIDITFLVCAADLWDADHSREMNLVQHPSYHYKPSPVPAPSRLIAHASQPVPGSSSAPTGLPMAYNPTGRKFSNASQESVGVGERDQLPPASGENWAPPPTYRSRRPSSDDHADTPPHPLLPPTYPRSQSTMTGESDLRSSSSAGDASLLPVRSSPSQSSQHLPITSQRRMSASQTSPTTTTFAFQAPVPLPIPQTTASEGAAMSNRQVSYNSMLSAPRTASSSGQRPWTALTNRPSTSATSHSIHAAASSSGAVPDLTDIACVKNLVGALTTNAHRLRAPLESTDGVWFVFHDLR